MHLRQEGNLEFRHPAVVADDRHTDIIPVITYAFAAGNRPVDPFGMNAARKIIPAETLGIDKGVEFVNQVDFATLAETGMLADNLFHPLEIEVNRQHPFFFAQGVQQGPGDGNGRLGRLPPGINPLDKQLFPALPEKGVAGPDFPLIVRVRGKKHLPAPVRQQHDFT